MWFHFILTFVIALMDTNYRISYLKFSHTISVRVRNHVYVSPCLIYDQFDRLSFGKNKKLKKNYYLKLNGVQRLVVVNENKINSTKPKCGQCSSKLFYLSVITRFCRSSFSYSGMTKTAIQTDGRTSGWMDGRTHQSTVHTKGNLRGIHKVHQTTKLNMRESHKISRNIKKRTEYDRNPTQQIGGETKWEENNKSFFKFTLNWNSMSFDFPRNSLLWS